MKVVENIGIIALNAYGGLSASSVLIKSRGGASMNKAELVEVVAKNTCTKKEAQTAVESVLDAIRGSLKKKEPVAISGFGTFKVKETKARQGRNPKTGETIQIPAKKKIAFRASKELKSLLN